MRPRFRPAVLSALALILVMTLLAPAAARQKIRYTGRTTPLGQKTWMTVVKKDSGTRILKRFEIWLSLTCEDDTFDIYLFRYDGDVLDDDGAVHVEGSRPGFTGFSFILDGTIRWGSGEGTFELTLPGLTSDGQAQLCSTGLVEWQIHRRRSTTTHSLDRHQSESLSQR